MNSIKRHQWIVRGPKPRDLRKAESKVSKILFLISRWSPVRTSLKDVLISLFRFLQLQGVFLAQPVSTHPFEIIWLTELEGEHHVQKRARKLVLKCPGPETLTSAATDQRTAFQFRADPSYYANWSSDSSHPDDMAASTNRQTVRFKNSDS